MKIDVIIIGAGPAGASCAIWLKQLGFEPLLVDKNDRCGGLQLSNPYTNTWIATSAGVRGADVAKSIQDNIDQHQVATRLGTAAESAAVVSDHVSVRLATGEVLHAPYLVLAGGVAPKSGGFASRLGLLVGPGNAVAATDFSNAKVAILGGGDSALENYSFIKARQASQVKVFARSLRARAEMLDKVNPEDVCLGNYEVDPDARTVNGERFDTILVLYGYEAHESSLLGLRPLLRPDGFVFTDPNCQTSLERVFAVGELAQRAHPCCVTSMADGVVAAKALQRLLESGKRAQFLGSAKRLGSLISKAVS